MADIDVKELAVLSAYSSKLNDFKTGTTAVGALIDRQIRKIHDDLANKKNQASNSMNFVEEQADKVISRYDYALGKCENARLYIGETDLAQLLRFILVFLANQRFVFLICFTVFYKF